MMDDKQKREEEVAEGREWRWACPGRGTLHLLFLLLSREDSSRDTTDEAEEEEEEEEGG